MFLSRRSSELDLSENKLASIPSELGNLFRLDVMDLSSRLERVVWVLILNECYRVVGC